MAARRFAEMYGEGPGTRVISRAQLTDATIKEMAAWYEKPPVVPAQARRPTLKLVPQPEPTEHFTFDDLTPSLQKYVRKQCRELGISTDDVKVYGPMKVTIP